MLDHLRLAIPILPVFARSNDNHYYFNGDFFTLGLPAATRNVSRADDGKILTGELYHPYESLGSDYTDMAMKFYADTMNTLPYVEIKASPLKLLQGHNVYGFECIKLGATEMLGMLIDAYPALCEILDFENIEVLHLDTTYYTKLPHQNMVQPVLNYLSNISVGHRKAKSVKYDNYIAWGNDNARYLRAKAYGKSDELKSQISKIQKQAEKGNLRATRLLIAMHKAAPVADAAVRFEARVCKTYLTKNGFPSNLWQLIKCQQSQPRLLEYLWLVTFFPIFKALEGQKMNFADDGEVLNLLRQKLSTITKSGKISYTKANNAMNFYELIRLHGYDSVKKRYSENAFYTNLRSLKDAGIPLSVIQNLNKNPNGTVIPFIRLVEIKFNEQTPPDYQVPTSKYADYFKVA